MDGSGITPVASLAGNRLLASLDAEDRDAVRASSRRVELRRGDILYERGQAIEWVDFPIHGAVSLLLADGDDQTIETALIGPDGLTCAASFHAPASGRGRAQVSLAGDAWRIAAPELRRLADSRPGLRRALEAYALGALTDSARDGGCNALHRLDRRVARWLLRAQDYVGQDEVPVTHEGLAAVTGALRSSITGALHALEGTGAISCKRGRTRILDRKRLMALSCDCYEPGEGAGASPVANGGGRMSARQEASSPAASAVS